MKQISKMSVSPITGLGDRMAGKMKKWYREDKLWGWNGTRDKKM